MSKPLYFKVNKPVGGGIFAEFERDSYAVSYEEGDRFIALPYNGPFERFDYFYQRALGSSVELQRRFDRTISACIRFRYIAAFLAASYALSFGISRLSRQMRTRRTARLSRATIRPSADCTCPPKLTKNRLESVLHDAPVLE